MRKFFVGKLRICAMCCAMVCLRGWETLVITGEEAQLDYVLVTGAEAVLLPYMGLETW